MFLHSWIIAWGVAAAGLPVLIHWLTRPRPARLPLSTIRFVQAAVAQRRSRHRLRDFVILALRTLAVLLLAAAIARPLWQQSERPALDEAADTVRVVIVDASQSMAAELNGVAAWERGRPLVARELEFRAGLRCNLILAAARPVAVFPAPSTNFAALREALSGAAPLPQRLNTQPALNAAGEMLALAGAGQRREVVVISDFQRSNWAAADFSTLPEGTVVRLQSCLPEESPGNLALLRVGTAGRAEAGQETRLAVDVGNYTPATVQARVEVRLGDSVFTLTGSCPPQARTTLTTNIRLETAGWHVGEARLVGASDALPQDNVRPCAVEIFPPPVFALVTRQAERQRPSSSYYLERALAPGEAGEESARRRVLRLDPDALDPQALAPANLIVVDRPGRLSSEAIALLGALLRRGKGLLYIASDVSDATNLKLLTDAPNHSLRLPVEFQPPPAGQERRNLSLTMVRREQPPFALFGDSLTSLVSPLRFAGGLATRRQSGGLEDEVLASYSDGTACLVVATSAEGSVAVLNADLERSNLPASSLFVPLLDDVTRLLLKKRSTAAELASGEPAVISLPGDDLNLGELTIAGGEPGAAGKGELVREPFGIVWRMTAAGAPGVYEVKWAGQTVFTAVATIPESESDLRTLSADVFRDRLAGQRDVRFHSYSAGAPEKQDTLWAWLAVACIAAVLGEFLALRLFRRVNDRKITSRFDPLLK